LAAINPQQVIGKWQSGIALDLHTLSSTYLGVNAAGHEIYDTKRSEIGELLYRLKYRGDMAAAKEIIDTTSNYLKPHRTKFDLIVPVPPSGVRNPQPVITVATGVGAALGCPVVQCITTTRETAQLKGVLDPEKRKELVNGLYAVDAAQTTGKNILLFDDLFRSGATMNAITDVLIQAGKAASVRVITLTRTRSNQ
jgi:predicted amidophosphoribosyltransferase